MKELKSGLLMRRDLALQLIYTPKEEANTLFSESSCIYLRPVAGAQRMSIQEFHATVEQLTQCSPVLW